ncbi:MULTISPECIES: phage tail protein [unclassified Paenibacillus]|uniref:phage tail protein n=1 Tax=unclassified Paenibacillus TaxID=185978 RepID=UPI0036426D85
MQDPYQFFSFNKRLDWDKGSYYNLRMVNGDLAIHQTEKYAVHKVIRCMDINGPDVMMDFTVGQGGKLFVLDAEAAIWSYDAENRHTELMFGRNHQLFSGHALLASRGDTLFVADPVSERRVAAYSISNSQLLWAVENWKNSPIYPLAVASDLQKRLYTVVPLDMIIGMNGKEEVPEGGRIGILQWDAAGEVVGVYQHDSLRLDQRTDAEQLKRRYDAAVSEAGKVHLFDAYRNLLTVFKEDGTFDTHFPLALEGSYAGLSIDTNNNIYIGDSRSVGVDEEDERFILKFGAQGDFQSRVSGFRGRTDKLLINSRNRMYVLNGELAEITLLELQQRTLELEESSLPEGIYLSSELDTTLSETEWHRFQLEAVIPEETQVRISYFASDRKELMVDGEFVDLSRYLTNSDITLKDKLRSTRDLWSEPIVNPRDALLMNAQGRYLWFKLEIMGSERQSPLLHKLRVYFPRQSLISYLPPIYQEMQDESRFLDRFLSMFGTFFQDMEEKIDRISKYFDPDAVHGHYLEWLGTWLAVSEDESWGEGKLRQLIKQAPELYKLRGTRQGLSRMLQIYTGSEPYIIEYFQMKQMQERSELRELLSRLYGDNPYVFCVMLPQECVQTDKQRLIVESIINDQKPAFTEGKLTLLQPWMYIDMHTYMGINTFLSEPTLLTLDQGSSMPYNTVLIDLERDKRMDIHTRLGLDSELE